ncbi:META domain-containing protein [Ostreibacterium oceani]|uniref:META domain-containing protein n=1 Tax=Ostreibacterium oceani TaxID=2654998 RepID=A0A6N7ESS6_9GAMM|nr:META domain-containing protein [Ostreibacterium oceani]MPV85552.1 META domain-containing protein [Ostreibacterium oceani]
MMKNQILLILGLAAVLGCSETPMQSKTQDPQKTQDTQWAYGTDTNATTATTSPETSTKAPADSENLVADKQQPTSSTPLNGEFNIVRVKDYDAISPLPIAFNADSQNISGSAGCNRFSGSYQTTGQNMTLSKIASTKRFCLEKGVSQLENHILQLLGSIHTFKTNENAIDFFDNNNQWIMTIEPSEPLAAHPYQIKYTTQTMVATNTLIFSGSQITCQTDDPTQPTQNNHQNNHSKNLSTSQVKDLLDSINELPMAALSTLTAPSDQRHLDGAAYAKLTIIDGDTTYEVPDFDHGNPPAAVARLVAVLLRQSNCPNV